MSKTVISKWNSMSSLKVCSSEFECPRGEGGEWGGHAGTSYPPEVTKFSPVSFCYCDYGLERGPEYG